MPNISEIANEINSRAIGRPIGNLQNIRQELKGSSHPPTQRIFDGRTISDNYAFHVGGRPELQFNIGTEDRDGQEIIRYGVAFSLEPSRTFNDIDVLRQPVARFNEFLRVHPYEFSDLRMWCYQSDVLQTEDYVPVPIPDDRFRPGAFIFLGMWRSESDLDYEEILDTFDRLLPLYRYVQGTEDFPFISAPAGMFSFKPGCSVKPSGTVASIPQRELDITLRHNDLQSALHAHLVEICGSAAVGTETSTVAGCRIDAVVRRDDGSYWFYEIKTAFSARACIRAALAQLIEYSFWPMAQEAERLVVVGEPPLLNDSKAFLELLRSRFGIPIYYQQFDMTSRSLMN